MDKLSFIEGAGAEGNKYLGICAVPDRRLCCAPNNATPVLVVDPKIDKLSFLEGAGQWAASVAESVGQSARAPTGGCTAYVGYKFFVLVILLSLSLSF